MPIVRYHPDAPLDRYVRFLWWSQRDTPQDYCEYIFPSGGVQLLFTLHETPIICWPSVPSARPVEWSGSVVHGPQQNYYISGPKPRGAVAGVAFRPGAAGAVLGVAAPDLVDQHVALSALWGKPGQELHDRLMAAPDHLAVFRILEQSLNTRIQRSLVAHPAIAHALRSRSRARIAELQHETGYSAKHFIALFKSAVGITPKHYWRIQRFNTVLRCLAAEGDCNLAETAAAVGYSDQAHMTREFREFAGITPTQYRPTGSDRPLHHRAAKRPLSNSR
ncbi:MAG TPA: helix-turn-helix domain-containing protein [Steroidobacteraceae bacterium]|nr:helix-turn-helix domain-containing protein [Steroidobacteraceae bacterium]